MKKKSKHALAAFGMIFAASLSSLPLAWGAADIDRQYDLGTIGAMRAVDNVDGLFGDYVAAAYKEYFAHENRFVYNDLSRADSILEKSSIPYSKLVYDSAILGGLARKTRTESIIRTKVIKEGDTYAFTLEWLHSPGMEVMATHSFTLSFSLNEQNGAQVLDSEVINAAIRTNLTRLISSIPIQASITGRDDRSVTVNIGNYSPVKSGDTLVVSTLDTVAKHPLLKTVVAWNFTPTGKVVVEEIEDGMAFCRITEEEPGREIARYQKVVQVIHPPVAPVVQEQLKEAKHPLEVEERPRLGWAAVGLLFGGDQWQYSSSTPSLTQTGGGMALGGKGAAEVWLTRLWLVAADLRYSFWTFTQKNQATGVETTASQNGGVSGSLFMMKGSVGYVFLNTPDFFGPKAWTRLSYRSTSYLLPTSTSERTGPLDVSSILIGLGGELPVMNRWGVVADLNFRLFSAVTADWTNDLVTGTTDVDFFVGGYYRFNPRLTLRAGLDMVISGADFSSGISVNQKVITFAPALLYYF